MIYAVISCRNKVGRLICFSRNARGVINLHSRPVQGVEMGGEREGHRGKERNERSETEMGGSTAGVGNDRDPLVHRH